MAINTACMCESADQECASPTCDNRQVSGTTNRIIEVADLTDAVLVAAEDIVDGWYPEGRIDWSDFLERLENHTDCDFGSSMLSPAINKIQRHVRAYRKM